MAVPLVTVLLGLSLLVAAEAQHAPEQVHLSLGASADEMVVSWVTQSRPDGASQVVYWREEDEQRLKSIGTWKAHNVGSLLFERLVFNHRVLLTNLSLGETYMYQVGSGLLTSKVFSFRTLRQDPDYVPKIAIYGDLGKDNGQSMPKLVSEVQKGNIDIIFHIGDMAYDLNEHQGRQGDEFMRKLEPIASRVAYQTLPGNHESAWNFSHYDSLFAMVDQRSGHINNHFYSTTVGPVRVIGISTEFYFFVIYGTSQMGNQFRWLEKELKEANKAENRKTHPWVVVAGHRPLYCSSVTTVRYCSLENLALRNGYWGKYGLDKLFYEQKVDVYFSGHTHAYERMYPVYGGFSNASKLSDPYDNPWAPVHIVAGSAGCREHLHKFGKNPSDWSAVRIPDYGYSMLYPLNATHLRVEQISVLQVCHNLAFA